MTQGLEDGSARIRSGSRGDANLVRYVANRITQMGDASGLRPADDDPQTPSGDGNARPSASFVIDGNNPAVHYGPPINTDGEKRFRDEAKKRGLEDEADRLLEIAKN